MFVPQEENITIYQGSTFLESFNLELNGVPYDLTDWKARMQIRESYESSVVIEELTTENGGIVVYTNKDTNGTITESGYTLEISAEKTAAYTFASGVYDIELVAPTGRVGRIQQGSVSVDPEVTR